MNLLTILDAVFTAGSARGRAPELKLTPEQRAAIPTSSAPRSVVQSPRGCCGHPPEGPCWCKGHRCVTDDNLDRSAPPKTPAASYNPPPVPQNCTREQPHDGPCNGWPCQAALDRMREQDQRAADRRQELGEAEKKQLGTVLPEEQRAAADRRYSLLHERELWELDSGQRLRDFQAFLDKYGEAFFLLANMLRNHDDRRELEIHGLIIRLK